MSLAANVVFEGGLYTLRGRPALVIEHTSAATACVVRNDDGSASSVALGASDVAELERIATPAGANGRLADPAVAQLADAASVTGPSLTADINPVAPCARSVLRYALRDHSTWDKSLHALTVSDASGAECSVHARVVGVHTRPGAWPVLELDTFQVHENAVGHVDVHTARAHMAVNGMLTADVGADADADAGRTSPGRVTAMAPVPALPTALTAYRRLAAATRTAAPDTLYRPTPGARYLAVRAPDGMSVAVTVPRTAARGLPITVGVAEPSSGASADADTHTAPTAALDGQPLADGAFAFSLGGVPLASLLPVDDLKTVATEAAKVPGRAGRPFGGVITAGATPELMCGGCKHAMTATLVAAGPPTETWGGLCADCVRADGGPTVRVELGHIVAALGNSVFDPRGTMRASHSCDGCDRRWDASDASMAMHAMPLMAGNAPHDLCYSCAVTAAAQCALDATVLTHIDMSELETRADAARVVRTACARWLHAARVRATHEASDAVGDERAAWDALNRACDSMARSVGADCAWLATAHEAIDGRAADFAAMRAPAHAADHAATAAGRDPVAALTAAGAHVSARLLSRKRTLVARMRAHTGASTLTMPTDAAWAAAPAWVLPEYAATTGKFAERWLESMWRPATASASPPALAVATSDEVCLPSPLDAVRLGCPWLRAPAVGMLRVPRPHETAPEAHVVCVDKGSPASRQRTVAHVLSAAGLVEVRSAAPHPAVRELWGRNATTLLKGGLLEADSRAYLARSTAHSLENMGEALAASAEEPGAGAIAVVPRTGGDGAIDYFTTTGALTPVSPELGAAPTIDGAAPRPVVMHDPVRLWACAAERLMSVPGRDRRLHARVAEFVARYAPGFVRHAGSDPWGDVGVMDSDAHAHLRNLLTASLGTVHTKEPGAWGVYVLDSSPTAGCVLRRSPTHHPNDVMYVLSHLEFDDVSGLVTYESAHTVHTLSEVTARAHAYTAAAREPAAAAARRAPLPATAAAHIHRCPLDDTLVAAWMSAASPPADARAASVRALMAVRAGKPHGVPDAPTWGAAGRLVIGRLVYSADGVPAIETLADTMRGGRVPPGLSTAALDIVPSPDFCAVSVSMPAAGE